MTLPRPRLAAPLLALAGMVGGAAPAAAAWDNVFQVCCNDCKPRMSYSQYAGNSCPDNACAPRQSARVEYQQRSYYEPITVMKPEKYLEPVEVKSKSYYWEPVTSYTYSSYYDPCSQECQQVATPRTSYKLKEQCNTSMRYVERIKMVPVQSQRLVTETVPVTTYYGAPVRTYSSPITGSAGPRVDELRSPPPALPPSAIEGERIPATNVPVTGGMSYPKPSMPAPKPVTVNARTTSRSTVGAVRGEVVMNDQQTPRPGAKLVFVNADDLSKREFVTADEFGNFDLTLPAGDWYVYLGSGTGKASYHKKITVDGEDPRDFRVVSR